MPKLSCGCFSTDKVIVGDGSIERHHSGMFILIADFNAFMLSSCYIVAVISLNVF